MNHISKQSVSKIEVNITIGFLYWLAETHNLRGIKDSNGTISIERYPAKITSLLDEYNKKYPDGLTGWGN